LITILFTEELLYLIKYRKVDIMCKSDCAVDCFNNGYNCAQAVFSTYCEQLGLDKTNALKIAGSFGGGMGFIGETCGAVTGAIMLIGLKHGKVQQDDNKAKESTYHMVQEFTKRFKEENDFVKCTELIGYDLSTFEGLKAAREANMWNTICAKLVKDSAQIIEDLLDLK
jgi:C_GCAxxG_C_C family probable redox protein